MLCMRRIGAGHCSRRLLQIRDALRAVGRAHNAQLLLPLLILDVGAQWMQARVHCLVLLPAPEHHQQPLALAALHEGANGRVALLAALAEELCVQGLPWRAQHPEACNAVSLMRLREWVRCAAA